MADSTTITDISTNSNVAVAAVAKQQLSSSSLSTLPPDLFSDNILAHLSRFPNSLSENYDAREDVYENLSPYIALSRTSRHLNAIIKSLGYLTFVKTRYPPVFRSITRSSTYTSNSTHFDWRSVTRNSRNLELNWFDRSFLRSTEWKAENFAPQQQQQGIQWGRNRDRQRFRQGRPQAGQQTMGCTPVLDVLDSSDNSSNGGVEDVVVAGVGTDIAVILSGDNESVAKTFTAPGRNTQGVDDISGIHLIEADRERGEYKVLVARVSGSLKLLQLSGDGDVEVIHTFQLGNEDASEPQEIISSSRYGDIVLTTHENNRSQITRGYGISLHTLSSPETYATESMTSKPWCSTFMSQDNIAIGCAAGFETFRLLPDGRITSILRKPTPFNGSEDESTALSVNSLTPISHYYGGSESILASGWYDGCTRLYDLRTPQNAVLTLLDPLRHGEPIYSLLQTSPTSSQLLSGSSSYSLLVIYDIRKPNRRNFYGNKPLTFPQNASVYLGVGAVTSRGGVYSLASDGAGVGRKIYAGLEGMVMSLRFAGEGVDGCRFDEYVGRSMYYHDPKYRSEQQPALERPSPG